MDSRELFKSLVIAYKEGRFEEKVSSLLEDNKENRLYVAKLIAVLCGISIDCDSQDFAQDLRKAVENFTASSKVVTRLKHCTMNCSISNGKTLCQSVCPFDAIITDEINHTTYIDNYKCIDCGLCIGACPNNNYMDKCEALPLLSILN